VGGFEQRGLYPYVEERENGDSLPKRHETGRKKGGEPSNLSGIREKKKIIRSMTLMKNRSGGSDLILGEREGRIHVETLRGVEYRKILIAQAESEKGNVTLPNLHIPYSRVGRRWQFNSHLPVREVPKKSSSSDLEEKKRGRGEKI